MNKVILAKSLETALEVEKIYDLSATVEAEYGETVVKGDIATLAHHVPEFSANPAPCNNSDVPIIFSGTIMVSHIDLDTIGGIMALNGEKPEDQKFWQAAEFIDLNGPHRIHEVDETSANKLRAYWKWSQDHFQSIDIDAIDITRIVSRHADAIKNIIHGDSKLLKDGIEWAKEVQSVIEKKLLEEGDGYRLFVSDDTSMTPSAYYSPKDGEMKAVTISFNTMNGSLTLATSDGSVHCRNIMQQLFGKQAGGHPGIAGSPRGKRMSLDDLRALRDHIKKVIKSKRLTQ